MKSLFYTDSLTNFSSLMEQVCDDHEPVIITSSNKRPVVMMSLEDYESIEETLYLLRSPKNAQRLRDVIQNDQKGKIKEQQLTEV